MSRAEKSFQVIMGVMLLLLTGFTLSLAVASVLSPDLFAELRTAPHPIPQRPPLFGMILLIGASGLAWQTYRVATVASWPAIAFQS